jgi:hypothetical protein
MNDCVCCESVEDPPPTSGWGAVRFKAAAARLFGPPVADQLVQIVDRLNTLDFPKAPVGFYLAVQGEDLWGRDRRYSRRCLGRVDWAALDRLSIARYAPRGANPMTYMFSWRVEINERERERRGAEELSVFAKRFVGVSDLEIAAFLKYLWSVIGVDLDPSTCTVAWFADDHGGDYNNDWDGRAKTTGVEWLVDPDSEPL